MEKPSSTTLWLVAGVGALLLLVLFFANRNEGDQDRLGDAATSTLPETAAAAKGCSGGAVANGLKRALFARALEIRGQDEEAYRQIESLAVIRMENEALEEELSDGLACTASVAIDLPPGIVAGGGRRNMMGDVDYLVAADGSGVALRNAPPLVTTLSSLSRSNNAITAPLSDDQGEGVDPMSDDSDAADAAAAPEAMPPPRVAQPSFDCARARTFGEKAVCNDSGLATLDRQMADQFNQAFAGASPDRQALLRQTRGRFLAFRDNCRTTMCATRAYLDRMREISDIMTGRWQPPR